VVTWRTVLLVNLIVIASLAIIYFGVGHGPRQDWLACQRLFAAATTQQDTLVIDRTVAPSAQRRASVAGPAFTTCGALRRLHADGGARK
jgi:hypothetical protein